METKKCPCCGRELPVELFNKSKKNRDGLSTYCKFCHREKVHESYARKKAEKATLVKNAQEAADANPKADVIVTKDGRTLRRVTVDCKPLKDYSARELLEEIKRRGYVWDNMWVKTPVEYSKI